MARLRLACLLAPLLTQADPPTLELQLFPQALAEERGAQCLDHTPAGYYIRRQDPKKWTIWLQGGGLCFEPIDCLKRRRTQRGSSKYWPTQKTEHNLGTTSLSPTNPMQNFSHVWVPYCSGDTYLGSTAKHHVFLGGMQMSGHLIIETIVEHLLNTTEIGSATDVILSGNSAGGIGTFHHADWLADILAEYAIAKHQAPPRVAGFPIEGVFFPEKLPVLKPEFDIGITEPLDGFMSRYLRLLQDPWYQPSCTAASKAEGFPLGDCFDVSRNMLYTRTPLFIGMNRFDRYLIRELGLCSSCKGTDSAGSSNGRFIRLYGSRTMETVIDLHRALPVNAWFVPNEFNHDGNFMSSLTSKEQEIFIQGTSLRDAFENWYWKNEDVVLVEPLCFQDGPCDCEKVDGQYTELGSNKRVSITQTFCTLTVDYDGTGLNGTIVGKTVMIGHTLKGDGRGAAGTLQANRDVAFADGGFWAKEGSCQQLARHFKDLKHALDVSVMQNGCALTITHGSNAKSAIIVGQAVNVDGWDTVGTLQVNGDVTFSDGGFWEKQDGNNVSFWI